MINARPREVIGVLPAAFRFLNHNPSLLLPLKFASSSLILGYFNYQGVARLKPGVTFAEASADVARMLPIWMASYAPAPGYSAKLFDDARIAPALKPFKQDAIGDGGRTLWIVMGTLAIVLLVACANVANMLLLRAEGRRLELAVHVALGAGRGRIARELLSESLVLGMGGGLLGLVLAVIALRVLVYLGPAQVPRLAEIGVDAAVVLFTTAISIVSGLLFGLVPAARYAGFSGTALSAGGRGQTRSRDRHHIRGALVILQIALPLVLLVSAGLLVRTLMSLRRETPGFSTGDSVQTLHLAILESQVREPEQVVRTLQRIRDAIQAVPGVDATSFAGSVPLDGRLDHDPIIGEGLDAEAQMAIMRAYNYVAPGLFGTLGTPILAGRDLTWNDVYEWRRVALISENVARELWGDARAAVGKRIRETQASPWREVIGVVGNITEDGVHRAPPATVYLPIALKDFLGRPTLVRRTVGFAVRSRRAGTDALLQDLRRAVWAINSDVPLSDVRTLGERYDQSMSSTAFTLVMLGLAGGMALLLGLVGIYAVMSSAVSQRRKEIGIRLALGAKPQEVLALVHRSGLPLTILGIGLGLVAAAAVTRVLSSVLFGVTPLDPPTYAAVACLLFVVAALATHIPALRATKVDPIDTLRED